MSGKAMGWALEQVTELPVDKLVLIAIGNFADENHQCFPSRKKLAVLAMCSVDTVDRAVKRLEDAGMLTKEKQSSTRGGLTSNAYTLHVGDYTAPTHKTKREPSRNLRLHPESDECGHPSPQDAATLAATDAATLAAKGAATGTVTEPSIEQVPPNPQGGMARTSGQAFWQKALNPQADHGVELLEGGRINLVNGTRAEWLDRFGGDDKALDLALIEAAGHVQPSSTSPLKLQVERKLAQIARLEHGSSKRRQTQHPKSFAEQDATRQRNAWAKRVV